ncbi:hypothetical protein ACFE04_022242 [Oxalis oulophora]
MEEKHEEMEDVKDASSDSQIADSDDSESSSSGFISDGLLAEEPLTDKDIEELVADFLEIESKAAEAQEALEEESLAKVESDVREELSQSYQGDELQTAVADEMAAYQEEWETTLDELETESSQLLEQLDGAGIELPSLYKWIESQAPNGCCTEAWKKRAHWVGNQVTGEVTESVVDAEKYLETCRPVRRKHGKLLEEGASGFLQKKVASDGNKEGITEQTDTDWSSFNKLFSDRVPKDNTSFGSKHWSSVYLASTPQQAEQMGLKFPGVDEVEEIDDIDGDSTDPFVADAIANENELYLSQEQRKNFRKVKEEDDANIDRKLQLRLKKRYRERRKKTASNSDKGDVDENLENNMVGQFETSSEIHKNKPTSNGFSSPILTENRGFKRSIDHEELNLESKRSKTVVIVSEDDTDGLMEADPCHLQSGDKFHCTACGKVAVEVYSHPTLSVIICRECKYLIEEKMSMKDSECSECYCGWCGLNTDLLGCSSCVTWFCSACIKRNIGEKCLLDTQASGWKCCRCSPEMVQSLTLELEKALESCYVTDSSTDSSDSDSENSGADIKVQTRYKKNKQKKKIRRILDDAELGEETKRKIAIEKERQERLKSLKVDSARSYFTSCTSYNGNLPEGATVEVLGDANTGYIVNVVREKGEEAVRIPPSVSVKLKPHQVAGIRFMWENIIQSIRKVKLGDKGLGCILAHTMGLGKTFQVVAFLYTAMRIADLGLRTALVVTPVNVLHNWRQEFMKWKPLEVKPLRVFMLEDASSREKRAELLAKWRTKGGIFLIGYTAFRNLSLEKNVKDSHMAKEISSALQDGPDILVCDEAHMIKNTRADTTQALKLVKSQRRIALTGSPLQNNLMEYYCMVDFVREGFLGSSNEFRNRFQNPIENGQHTNSTAEDVKIMNQRSHILYEQLKGFVQRMDMSVVRKDLPPKTVFVVAVQLSDVQRKLYKRFLDVHAFANDKVSSDKMRTSFFAGYQILAQILNHPGILQLRKDKDDSIREDAVDDCSSDEDSDHNTVLGGKPRNANDVIEGKTGDALLQKNWWNDLLCEDAYKELDYSGKMVLLIEILTMCSDIGDKALVFSQSLPTLDLIELYLSKLPRKGKKGKFWKKQKDWYRLDGSTKSSDRQKLVEKFNDPLNKRVKCTLISTRAGSLGINLYAANRVIIVDGSWNPTYDLQAIYRAWRYGQKKPVYAYRLLAFGTMEEKIYKRQVTKEGLAARVVDRQQVHRTISKEELLHLFEFGDDVDIPEAISVLSQENGLTSNLNMESRVGNLLRQKGPLSSGSFSSDKFMETLISKHHPKWISNCHEHETLLHENEEERLSKEEQDMAWEVYRKSLEWKEVQRVPLDESVSELKPSSQKASASAPPTDQEIVKPVRTRDFMRSFKPIRKCTNLAHLLTLRSQGTKIGSSTICGECAQEISWESLKLKPT